MGFFDIFKKKTEEKPGQPTETKEVFKMLVEDIFFIRGRGVVLTGKVAQGVVRVGDTIFVNNAQYKVVGIQMFRKLLDCAQKGDNVGILVNTENPYLCHSGDWISNTNMANVSQSSSPTVWLPEFYYKFRDVANTDSVYGEKIPSLITEYKSLYHEKAPKEEVNKAFVALMNEVVRTLFIVPFRYDEANEFPNDKVIHCTQKAANKFNIDSIVYRGKDMSSNQMEKLYWVKDTNTGLPTIDLDWWNISRISGSDGFYFEEQIKPRIMYPQTAGDGNSDFFLCFTGIDQYLKAYKEEERAHIALYTISDIIGIISSSEKYSGIIINPDTETHCFIGKEAFKKNA